MPSKPMLLIALAIILSSCSKDELMALENDDSLINENVAISSSQQTETENELFALINQHRSSLNLKELSFDSTSHYYANGHTTYMMENGHTSHANFEERAKYISKKTGASFVAENVAKDYNTLEQVLDAWLNSPNHRRNLEGDFTHSAISIKTDEEGVKYFTQIFFR